MAITVETALDQLKRCREDFASQVRARRVQARELMTGATATAKTIRGADAEAIAFLETVIADAATPAPLAQKLKGEVALHQRAKQDQAAEE